MSEEILKALMQLFALILKQDGGMEQTEINYVSAFLKSQIGESGTEEYMSYFRDASGTDINTTEKGKNLTSVLDSVRILGICKKINRTLNSSQKYVVLVRLYELIGSDRKLSEQRMAIIDTVSNVFRITEENRKSIEDFVLYPEKVVEHPGILSLSSIGHMSENDYILGSLKDQKDIYILRIPEVNLYFIRYDGDRELYLNGLGLHQNRIYILAKGSTLKLSQGKPLYYSDISAKFLNLETGKKISFVAEDVTYFFKNGIRGLKEISLEANHGNLIGIMGSSGSGKTTLLNVLSGIEKPSAGSVRINGRKLHSPYNDISGNIGYIPQDDLLIEDLTVFENLYFNAQFCFSKLSHDEIKEKVNKTLANLGLLAKKDMKVGSPLNKSISGGQRKRLNIALELIREPDILFVDEPTSGLSSRDSENVMDLMRELTLKGKLIFIVIHQPSSEIFKMFDRVVILDTGGVMVYYGNPVEAVVHFKTLDEQINARVGECPVCGNLNPELIFNIIEARVVDEYGNYTRNRKVSPEQWEKFYHESSEEKTENDEEEYHLISDLSIPGWLKQARIYFLRDLKTKISNSQYVLLSLFEAPVLGFILAYIIRYIADPSSEVYRFRENENIPIYIFMALIVSVFLGLTQSAEEIFKDRKILKREHFLNLSRSGYLVSKILILLIIAAIQSLLFVIVANSILEIRNMNLVYIIALFSTASFAIMLGLNISSAFNSAITIYIVIPLLIIPMMILSGAMFSFEKLNRKISRVDKVPLVAEFIPTRWSYEALMVNQFKNNYFQSNFYDLDKEIVNSDFKLSYYIPELEKRLDRVNREFKSTGKIEDNLSDLILITNELESETGTLGVEFSIPSTLRDPDKINSARLDSIKEILLEMKSGYLQHFTEYNQFKENKLQNYFRNLKDIYYTYLDDYQNESVADVVRKIYEKKKIIESGNRLVRLSDPVYFDPEPSGLLDFRTHFFAPEKYFAGKYFETFGFNMLVIWILTAILYVCLYYNLLRKLLTIRFKSRSS